jgi:hypothetical protein
MYLAELNKLLESSVNIGPYDEEYYNYKTGHFTEQCPEVVLNVSLDYSELVDLTNAPKKVIGKFDISYTNVQSLVGSPREVGSYYASSLMLTSLKGISPIIHGDAYLNENRLTSLEGIHRHIKVLGSDGGDTARLDLSRNPIKRGGLGLLLINGFFRTHYRNSPVPEITDFGNAIAIINEYTEHNYGRKALVECQERLLDAGLDAYAEL